VDDRARDDRGHDSTGRVQDVRPRRRISPQLRRVSTIAGLRVTGLAMQRHTTNRTSVFAFTLDEPGAEDTITTVHEPVPPAV
jgi:hypothetical protein